MKKIIILLFVALSAQYTLAQKSVLLRLNYDVGDEYEMVVNLEQNTGGLSGMDMSMFMNMKISEMQKDSVKHQIKVHRIKMDMSQGGMNMSYDSEMKEEELDEVGKKAKEQFAPVLKGDIYTTLTRRGLTVKTVVVPSVPAMEQFGNNSNSLEFPEEKVSVGSSWTQEQEVQGVTTTIEYTVSKIENGKVYLDVSGTVGGMGSGTLKGSGEVDIKSGTTTKMSMVIDMTVAGMEMKTTSDTTMKKIN